MTTAPLVTAEVFEGTTFYKATRRGVEYMAHELGGRWFVSTHRLALGPRHIGGGRYYETLAEVAEKVPALAALDLLVEH